MTSPIRYRVPTVTPEVEDVRLSDFGIDEIREYLKQRSTLVNDSDDDFADLQSYGEGESFVMDYIDMMHVSTLLIGGQREAALEEILRAMSKYFQRPI